MVKTFTHNVEEKRSLNSDKCISSCARGWLPLYTSVFCISAFTASYRYLLPKSLGKCTLPWPVACGWKKIRGTTSTLLNAIWLREEKTYWVRGGRLSLFFAGDCLLLIVSAVCSVMKHASGQYLPLHLFCSSDGRKSLKYVTAINV